VRRTATVESTRPTLANAWRHIDRGCLHPERTPLRVRLRLDNPGQLTRVLGLVLSIAGWTHTTFGRERIGPINPPSRPAFRSAFRWLWFRAGQHVLRRIAHDDLPILGFEERHQRHIYLFTADGVPGNPNAVGRTKLGQTVVLGKILGREYVFSIRLIATLSVFTVAEPVNNQIAFNGHRFLLAVVEIDATTKAPGRRTARLIVDRVFPECRQLVRHTNLWLLGFSPGYVLGQLDRIAQLPGQTVTGREHEREKKQGGNPFFPHRTLIPWSGYSN